MTRPPARRRERSPSRTALRRLAPPPLLEARARILVGAARPPFPRPALDDRFGLPLRLALLFRRVPDPAACIPFQEHVAVGPPELRNRRQQLRLLSCAKCCRLLID